jgi:YVTN family beta-propeller protein
LVASVDVGYGQSSICCAPAENKVFCTTYNGRFVVVDAGSNRVVDSLETGDYFNESFYNPLNNKVYCVSSDSTVVVIDGATNQVLKTIAVGSGPTAFCHNPRQNRVYVANNTSASISVIRDSGGGVEETPNAELRTSNVATIVRGGLMMNDRGQKTGDRAELLDISGRKVLDLRPGANDVRALAPGVYFIRTKPSAVSRERSAVAKVVVTR